MALPKKMNKNLSRFLKNYNNYYKNCFNHSAKYVSKRLACALEKKIKCIITSREKGPVSLEDKLKNTTNLSPPLTDKKIITAMKDLAGARIALYFHSDFAIVESIIFEQFKVEKVIEHPTLKEKKKLSPRQLFPGYSSKHYIVNSEQSLGLLDNNGRRINMLVEIQVTSLFMHAWSEVEHDLLYKPKKPVELEYDELAILDSINGLACSAELQMESLKKNMIKKKLVKVPLRGSSFRINGKIVEGSNKKLIIIGQNLYSLLVEKDNFRKQLFELLESKKGLEVGIIVVEPGSGRAKQLAYGYPKFREHLDASIRKLKHYKRKSNKLGYKNRLKVGTSKKVSTETLFISDLTGDRKNGIISLGHTLGGTRPQERPPIVIEAVKHKKYFRTIVKKYEGLIKWRPQYVKDIEV